MFAISSSLAQLWNSSPVKQVYEYFFGNQECVQTQSDLTCGNDLDGCGNDVHLKGNCGLDVHQNLELERGCTIAYIPDEEQEEEPILGEVISSGYHHHIPYVKILFEKPIFDVLTNSRSSSLSKFITSCNSIEIPLKILRACPSFVALEAEAEAKEKVPESQVPEIIGEKKVFKPVAKRKERSRSQDPESFGSKDRADSTNSKILKYSKTVMFNSPIVRPAFIVPPIDIEEFMNTEGTKGIQGRKHSSYLDSTLISLFGFTDKFDSILLEENEINTKNHLDLINDSDHISKGSSVGPSFSNVICQSQRSDVRNSLCVIVNELRQFSFCSATMILSFRKLLGTVNPQFASSFMDAGEFIVPIFDQISHMKEFLRYDNGSSDFIHRINLDPQTKFHPFIGTQKLLEFSMKHLQLKFNGIPLPALILQMPRLHGEILANGIHGIIPKLTIDITDLLGNNDTSNDCVICNNKATIACLECVDLVPTTNRRSSGTFCNKCHGLCHKHPLRRHHANGEPIITTSTTTATNGSRIKLKLLAVICIRAGQFVAFVRVETHRSSAAGAAPQDSHWIYFDSNPAGHNPKHEILPDMGKWLSELEMSSHRQLWNSWKEKPAMLRQIVEDCHVCIYS